MNVGIYRKWFYVEFVEILDSIFLGKKNFVIVLWIVIFLIKF